MTTNSGIKSPPPRSLDGLAGSIKSSTALLVGIGIKESNFFFDKSGDVRFTIVHFNQHAVIVIELI